MGPLVISGTGNPALAESIAQALGPRLGRCLIERFPDGELRVELGEDVRGRDVYLVQSMPPNAEQYLLELLMLADACRRAGAQRVSAVVPYLAYARQDRRSSGHEALGARVVADALQSAGIERMVTLDLHSPAVEGCFRIPMDHLSAASVLCGPLGSVPMPAVLVSPDIGGLKRAEKFAELLKLPLAVVQKTRLSGSEVSARALVGDVRGHAPILVDDMLSTGGTIEAAVHALLEAGCANYITVAVTHSLLVGGAMERMRALPIRRIVTTDSLPPTGPATLPIERVSVAPMLAAAIRRINGQANGETAEAEQPKG